jgi:hypothetical protein
MQFSKDIEKKEKESVISQLISPYNWHLTNNTIHGEKTGIPQESQHVVFYNEYLWLHNHKSIAIESLKINVPILLERSFTFIANR